MFKTNPSINTHGRHFSYNILKGTIFNKFISVGLTIELYSPKQYVLGYYTVVFSCLTMCVSQNLAYD